MRRRLMLIAVPALLATAACQTTINTLPDMVSPSAAVQYLDLDVPAGLEVRSVDFATATYSDASGGSGGVSTTLAGRAFVKVYAVRRETGEQYLLIYEDIAHRRQPIQIVRFRPSTAVGLDLAH